jgi:hypothetical protein
VIKTGLKHTCILSSVADPHHLDPDADQDNADPDPIFLFDADPDPDRDPSFQIKAQNLGKVLK